MVMNNIDPFNVRRRAAPLVFVAEALLLLARWVMRAIKKTGH